MAQKMQYPLHSRFFVYVMLCSLVFVLWKYPLTTYALRFRSAELVKVNSGRLFLIQKIFLIGFLFFLSTTCPSPVAAQNNLHSYLTMEEQRSTPQELEIFPLQEGPQVETLELPARDQSGDDLNLEILLNDRRKKEFDFDIPIVINARVEEFIQYFQTTLRDRFVTSLARSEKYIPFMKNLLKEHGLPEDLVYMALIESGFDPYAYSRSKASGPWQFIFWTGKKYGLRVSWWVDERRDPEKSTLAAAKYLKDLHEKFSCWYLAAAGYNAGEQKIITAMKRYRTEDFWKLTKYRYLKRETKNYVPQMIAAALIAKDPERYGFTDVEYQEPLRYEKVKVPELTDLFLIAKACETSLEEIKDLNPELRRGVTPPNETEYEIKIPFGKKDLFPKNFEALQPLEKFQFKTHLVKKGETLPRIANLYRVELEPLLEINHLKKTSPISKGMTLLIPISKDEEIKPLAVAKKKNGKVRNGRPEKQSLSL
jgi:membrane-bound lytic murein transglycosylase D